MKKIQMLLFSFLLLSQVGYMQSGTHREHPMPKKIATFDDILNSKALDLSGYIPFYKELVPTFTSVSYYYPSKYNNAACMVYYRKLGSQKWRDAFKLVTDKTFFNYSGSIVDLNEGSNQLIIRGIDTFLPEEILISTDPFKVLD